MKALLGLDIKRNSMVCIDGMYKHKAELVFFYWCLHKREAEQTDFILVYEQI